MRHKGGKIQIYFNINVAVENGQHAMCTVVNCHLICFFNHLAHDLVKEWIRYNANFVHKYVVNLTAKLLQEKYGTILPEKV